MADWRAIAVRRYLPYYLRDILLAPVQIASLR
jgi:hypothetical protein